MRNRITERDLSRIVKRVINEESNKQCDESSFRVMTKMLEYNDVLTLTYNKASRGIVTVSTDSPQNTKFPCWCRKEELLPYLK